MDSTSITALSLWDFALQRYSRPGVADACIELQDQQGVNVNILLWCLWLAARGQLLDSKKLHTAQHRIHAWDQHYIRPLRHLRRRMKVEFGTGDSQIEAVRQQIKQAELTAEQQLHIWLDALARSWPQDALQPLAADDNIRVYLQALGIADSAITHSIRFLVAEQAD
jgi:uncharacterized protein (TIGR02444 family)